MDNKKENIVFESIKFNRTDIGTPAEEIFGKEDWVKFGVNNDYPQELLRLFQNADGLHAAIIKRKVDMIAGLGFMDNLPLADFLKNKYTKEDLNKISYKCAFDLVLFGGYYLNVVWDVKGNSIAKVYHIPYERVRVQKPTREDGEVSNYYISRDWIKYKKEENKPRLITAFDFEDEDKRTDPETQSQLYACKMYSPGMDFYTMPTYSSIINWLKLSYEISTFHLKSVQNGYQPGLIISIPHIPTAQEREKVAQELKARSGSEEVNKPFVMYANDKDSMPEVTIAPANNNDQKFKELIQQINEEIYIGHASNNVVAGVAVAGKLGNSSEVKEQFSIFQKTVIAPLQNEIESSFNKLAEINGLPGELKLKTYTDYIDEVQTAPGATAPVVPGEPAAPSNDAVEQPTQS